MAIRASKPEMESEYNPCYYSSALGLFPEATLLRKQRNTTKVQSRLFCLLCIFNYSVRTASYGMPFILPVQDQGRFEPLQLVQITC